MNTKNANSSVTKKGDNNDIKLAASKNTDQKSAKDSGTTAVKKSPAKK
jgi:hypothetical protein